MFDFSTQCCFCGANNENGGSGYGGERGCQVCGKGGTGEPDEPVMAYRDSQRVIQNDKIGIITWNRGVVTVDTDNGTEGTFTNLLELSAAGWIVEPYTKLSGQ